MPRGMTGVREAKKIAKQAKATINKLLDEDTEEASEHRRVAVRVVDVVEDLCSEIRSLENDAKRLRWGNEKLNETIADRNVTINYLESELERG